MNFIYNRLIWFTNLIVRFLALFNTKLKKGVIGRDETFTILKQNLSKTDNVIWFHCASLGEYEQGLPVFEKIRESNKSHKIILSFFSPSGYEIRKNTPVADIVIYLPLDTKANAKNFISLLKPKLSVFVKYDVWPNYLNELNRLGNHKILISAAFRPNQIYFKWYGGLFKKALSHFDHIFTQNKKSKELLESVGFKNVTEAGDTRFDRVTNQLQIDNTLDFVETFKNNKLLIVIGSSWDADEKLYLDYINKTTHDVKFLIAPHEMHKNKLDDLLNKINKKAVLYTDINNVNILDSQILILNTIGVLSKVYAYADIAYVGGAAGKTGLHNILEPATFGVPVLFGINHNKFTEATALINFGGGVEIPNKNSFNENLNILILDQNERQNIGAKSNTFISSQTGATENIATYIRNLL